MIKLDKNYHLESDSNNWMLKFEKTEKREIKGEVKEVTSEDTWYYPSIKPALLKYTNESSKESETVSELLEALNRIDNTIKKLGK